MVGVDCKTPGNKTSKADDQFVHDHIKSFSVVESHNTLFFSLLMDLIVLINIFWNNSFYSMLFTQWTYWTLIFLWIKKWKVVGNRSFCSLQFKWRFILQTKAILLQLVILQYWQEEWSVLSLGWNTGWTRFLWSWNMFILNFYLIYESVINNCTKYERVCFSYRGTFLMHVN
jgi:hypothetical protein